MIYERLRLLPKKSIEKVYETLNYIFPDLEDMFIRQLKICGLSARLCYSNKSVNELIEKDEKLNDNEKLVKFLQHLSNLGHTSIFSHNILKIKIDNEYINNDRYYMSIDDLAIIVPELYIFRNWSYDNELRFNSLPVFLYLLETLNPYGIKYYVDYKRYIKENNKLKVEDIDNTDIEDIKYIYEQYNKNGNYEGYLFINLRAYIDILKAIDKENEFWNKVNNNIDRIEDIKYFGEIPIPYFDGKIHLINIDKERPVKGSVIFEGVSRVFTHQLVRHISFYYEQRSNRYTKPFDINDINKAFVNPAVLYNDSKHINDIFNEFKNIYISELKTYDKLINEYKVKKEDARYILGDGMRTTIMMSFTQYGLDNFFEQRADNPKAQTEIRIIAKLLKEFIYG